MKSPPISVPDGILSWTGYPFDRPLGTRVPKDLSEAQTPLVSFLPSWDPCQVAAHVRERPNVYVRRARKALGLRPEGPVYQHDSAGMPPACQEAFERVVERAARQPHLETLTLSAWLTAGLSTLLLSGLLPYVYYKQRGRM